jgi:acyl carrier protein
LFSALAARLPGARAAVLLKRGRADNELTRFRYDAVLRLDGTSAPAVESLDWRTEGLSPAALERRLDAERPAVVAVDGIPSARLAGARVLGELLQDPAWQERTAEELQREIRERAARDGGVEPEAIWEIAERRGYAAAGTWSAGGGVDGCFAVELRLRSGLPAESAGEAPIDHAAAAATTAITALAQGAWLPFANTPLAGNLSRRLVGELRRYLAAELPEVMVPAAIVLLDALPLTPHGKVDRRALPAPERPAGDPDAYVAPATPLDRLLADVCAELLGVERVGMHDNFFDLGGHSLLATQLVSRLEQEHGIAVTLQMVFDAADLAGLADRIMERQMAEADAGELEDMLRELDGLSGEEIAQRLADLARVPEETA